MQGLKRFYVRADFKDGEVRGMTVLYDQATENIMNPAAVVLASAFTAFPNVSGVAQIGAAAKRKVEYGSGIVVSQAGHILTDRALTDGCNIIVVSGFGDADLKAADAGNRSRAVARLWRAGSCPRRLLPAIRQGARRHLVGIADPQAQAAAAPSHRRRQVEGDTPEPSPQLGFSGAGRSTAQYRLVGMVELKTTVAAAVDSGQCAAAGDDGPGAGIREFLEGQKLSRPPRSLGPGGRHSFGGAGDLRQEMRLLTCF